MESTCLSIYFAKKCSYYDVTRQQQSGAVGACSALPGISEANVILK